MTGHNPLRQSTFVPLGLILSGLFLVEGEAAASASQPASSNPYRKFSAEHALWMEGWTNVASTIQKKA